MSRAGFPCAGSLNLRHTWRLLFLERQTGAWEIEQVKIAVTPSRAVETALGQEMARTMRHFQVRKWSTPHRGVAKKALAHPLPAKLAVRLLREPWIADAIFAGALYFTPSVTTPKQASDVATAPSGKAPIMRNLVKFRKRFLAP